MPELPPLSWAAMRDARSVCADAKAQHLIVEVLLNLNPADHGCLEQ